MKMARATRAKTKKTAGTPFVAARARYEKLVRGVGRFAASRVRALEKEMAALDLSARKSAVWYLHLARKELRLLDKELARIAKDMAPPVPRRTSRPKGPAVRAVTAVG
jgi:hypothetical protein